MRRYKLSEEQWQKISPLLPPQRPKKRGRPWADHRLVINGILWVLRTGAPWAEMPERYGSKSTAQRWLSAWQQDGTWERVLQAQQSAADHRGEVVWTDCAHDSTVVRAHQQAAGVRSVRKPKANGTEGTDEEKRGPFARPYPNCLVARHP
jgi:transposase